MCDTRALARTPPRHISLEGHAHSQMHTLKIVLHKTMGHVACIYDTHKKIQPGRSRRYALAPRPFRLLLVLMPPHKQPNYSKWLGAVGEGDVSRSLRLLLWIMHLHSTHNKPSFRPSHGGSHKIMHMLYIYLFIIYTRIHKFALHICDSQRILIQPARRNVATG